MIKLYPPKEEFATEDGLITPKNKNLFWAFGLVAGSWLICLLVSGVVWFVNSSRQENEAQVAAPTLTQFASESEFRNYLNNAVIDNQKMMLEVAPAELPTAMGTTEVSRYSETNTQVIGIDEPDIVKTNGEQLFISSNQPYYFNRVMPVPMMEPAIGIAPPFVPEIKQNTEIIQAVPVGEIKKTASIETVGNLLVTQNRLIVFENQQLTGFDITKPEKPIQTWQYELDSNRQVETARLVNGQIIIVTKLPVYQQSPCPLPMWKTNDQQITIPCTDVWRPEQNMAADTTYTISRLNPESGEVTATTTFVGAQSQTVVYVSNSAVYVTFTTEQSRSEILAKVLLSDQTTLINEAIKQRLQKVIDLDISQAAKQVEIEQILAGYTNSLNDDDRMKWEAEMTNLLDDFVDNNKRQIEQTVVTKVDLEKLNILASGQIPGRPLNQFSLDEFEKHLRIATTVGGRSLVGTKSVNDIYILDENLRETGKVVDLGKDERIYAVRFMGNRGFVVTFRETDPLYALDLSDPKDPKVSGELKIPGYSSYLHPLKKDLLVGIGKEDNRVKVSLFDVSDATNPTEVDKYQLPDYWSEVLSTHHAFLQDEKHQVFFVPADAGGYIFGYEGNKLSLKKTVAGTLVKRAVYINDYLYLVGENKLTVISETDWQTLTTFEW